MKSFFTVSVLLFGMGGLAHANDVFTSKNIYNLKPFDGPLANPHKGFCVPTGGTWCFNPVWEYARGGEKDNLAWDVVTHGSGYQRWDKLNPEKGVYDWNELDKLLNACEKNGIGYGLRVFPYSSYKGKASNYTVEQDYDWTPSFVYEAGAKKTYAKLPVDGVEYTLAVPVWDDPVYLQAHKEFAAALAEKYDGDPRIEYIDVRCFGNWGEWHVSHFDGSEMPSVEIQKDMLSYYASLFHKTLLVLPSNGSGEVYEHALSLGITKRDDGLIGTPNRENTLIPAYEANLPTIGENIAPYTTMLGYSDLFPGGYLKWTLERWKNVITTAHLTYYVLDQDSDAGYRFYSDNKVFVDSMTKVIGYNFRITDVSLLTVSDSIETTNKLKLTVKNTGVAPCFFDVYMVAEFVDSSGAVLSQFGNTITIPKGTFKDGMTNEYEFVYTVAAGQENIATMPGVSTALSLFESEDSYVNGKNPTVRFDNDGIQENKKLLLTSCPHEFGEWDTIKVATNTENGLRKHVCKRENCSSYEEFVIPAHLATGLDEDIISDNTNVLFATSNTICVTNVKGKSVSLFNCNGELCQNIKSSMDNLLFTVQNKGIYIVVVDHQKQIVIVK